MANMLFANNCNTTLASSLTNVATTMSVTSATGFPSPTGSQYFYCTLADAATQTTIEIVKVTAVSGTTFTITRGQDGTSGTAFAAGAVVSLRLVRANLNDFPKLDEANTFTFAPTFNTALAVGSGGTGLTSLTANYIPYGNGAGAFSSSSGFTFNGTALGVGVTPSTWSTGKVLEIGTSVGNAVWGLGTNAFTLLSNTYYNGNYLYANNGYATRYDNGAAVGGHYWYVAPSGTAGNAITFTQALTIFNSSGVGVGTNTDPGASNFSVAGEIYCTKGVGSLPTFNVYNSNSQTISVSTLTVIQFNSKDYDTNSNYDTTNYWFKPTVAGYYNFQANVVLATGATECVMLLLKNGSIFKYIGGGLSTGSYNSMGGSVTVSANGSTDYFQIAIYQWTGIGVPTTAGTSNTWFAGTLVRGV